MRTIAPSSRRWPIGCVLVLGAADAERAADVVAAGVAGGRLLRQRLQRGVDGQVDREADVDRRAVEHDAVRAVAVVGRRARRRARPRVGVEPVQRAGRLAQRLERLQHRLQRRRHLQRVSSGAQVAARLAAGARRGALRAGAATSPAARTAAPARCARRRRSACPSRAEVDAAGDAVPRVAPRHLARRDRHQLVGAPARHAPRRPRCRARPALRACGASARSSADSAPARSAQRSSKRCPG